MVDMQTAGRITILPALLATVFLLLLPSVYSIWISFHKNGISFHGFGLLLSDSSFSDSLFLSFLYSFTTVSFQVVLGLFAAAVVHRSRRWISPLSILLFLPYAVPSVVAVISWRFLFEDHGLLAGLGERALNVPPATWMGNGIFWTLIIISVWQFYPFVFVTLLARMRRIQPSLYQSAQLDGANTWQQFLHITFPLLKSTLLAVVMLRAAFMFTKFDTPWLLAGRTANTGVRVVPIYIYEKGYIGFQIGGTSGAAAAVSVAMGIALVVTFIWLINRILINKMKKV